MLQVWDVVKSSDQAIGEAMSYTDVEYKFKKIGENVQIGKNVYFRYPDLVEIGDNVVIDEFCYFTTGIKIGSYVHIGPHCSVIGGRKGLFVVKDFAGLSAGCRVICGSDSYLGDGLTNPTVPAEYQAAVAIGSVVLEKHAVLGTNTVVHPNIVIGEGAAVGSMSLVTKDIDPWTVNVGVPTRVVKLRPREIIKKFEGEMRERGLCRASDY